MGRRILVVAAHPDDEVLGAGATMARHTAEGDGVSVLLMGEGVLARHPEPGAAARAEVEALHRRARAANAALGVTDVRLERFADNRFDGVELLDLVRVVERVIGEVRPQVVYTHHPGDLNVDHQRTFHAVLTATRPAPGAVVREVLAFEVPSATDWSFGRLGPAFSPSLFVDVAATLAAKVEALKAYGEEIRPAPHARSLAAVEAAAVRWGAIAGCNAAEAFEIVRVIR